MFLRKREVRVRELRFSVRAKPAANFSGRALPIRAVQGSALMQLAVGVAPAPWVVDEMTLITPRVGLIPVMRVRREVACSRDSDRRPSGVTSQEQHSVSSSLSSNT